MSPKRLKALNHMVDQFNRHQGHTLTYKGDRHTKRGVSFVLKKAVLIGDVVFLQAEGSPFPEHYSDSMFECSCGEGK